MGAELHSYTDHAEAFQERASSRWSALHRLHIDLVIAEESGCRFLDNFKWTFIFSETNET